MKLVEYQDLYGKLGTAQDIDFLAENVVYAKELLLVIYTQRVVRDTTKKFYRVKAQARRLAFMWQNGTSLLEIARRFDFPAILTALMVLEQRRISRKNFWKMIHDIDSGKGRGRRLLVRARGRSAVRPAGRGRHREPDVLRGAARSVSVCARRRDPAGGSVSRRGRRRSPGVMDPTNV